MTEPMIKPSEVLVQIGLWLKQHHYRFVTVTPSTHAAVNRRQENQIAVDMRGVFGWNRPFSGDLLNGKILSLLEATNLVTRHGGLFRSRVRFSSIGERLYAHTAFPTTSPDAVFFGPDTYRFAGLLETELALRQLPPHARILDVCCGTGAGGIETALASAAATPELVLADISPLALTHARANAELAGLHRVSFACGDLFETVKGSFDLIIANPPYLLDAASRTYRHGGGSWGNGLSERIVMEGRERLAPGGRLVLYTGSAIVDGVDPFLEKLQSSILKSNWPVRYRELDPDIFGEELQTPAYSKAERIAAVAFVVQRPGVI